MQFFVIINGMQQGPYDKSQLQGLGLSPETPVWYAGLSDWTPAGEAQETKYLFGACEADGAQTPPDAGAWQQPNPQCPPRQPNQGYQQPQQPGQGWQQPNQGYQQQYSQGYQQPYQGYQQPYQGYQQSQERCPENYLVWSILVTILCCLPFGIVAIIKSSNVNSAFNRGDYEGALRNSRQARNWVIAAAVCGFVWGIVYGLYIFAVGFAGALGTL